mgnify:CR=1 FL=1
MTFREKILKVRVRYYKISTCSRGGGQNGWPTSADFVVLDSDFENFSLEKSSIAKLRRIVGLSFYFCQTYGFCLALVSP